MNSIFSAQKLVGLIPFLLLAVFPTPRIENYDRRLQDLRPRFRLLSTSRLPHRRFLYIPRTSRSPAPVPHRTFSPPDVNLAQLKNVSQMSFLPTPSIRQIVTVPTEDKTDFRAACFCHKHVVDVGYVCSVCLSSLVHFIALPVCLG